MSPRLIGITGLKGSGKSSTAAVLHSLGYSRLALASPLKHMLAMLGVTDAELNGAEKETPSELLCGHTPRFAMQTLGTEWGRHLIGEDLWVRVMELKLRALWQSDPEARVVIDDLRFENECECVKRLGGRVWRIQRTALIAGDLHLSERYVQRIPVDMTLHNNGTLEDLEPLVKYVLEHGGR